jgi:hypothetical protein
MKNWSSDLSLSSTVNVEAALFNERMLAWEPLIEPTIDASGTVLSPWCITCSIVPVSLHNLSEFFSPVGRELRVHVFLDPDPDMEEPAALWSEVKYRHGPGPGPVAPYPGERCVHFEFIFILIEKIF